MSLERYEMNAGWLANTVIDWAVQSWGSDASGNNLHIGEGAGVGIGLIFSGLMGEYLDEDDAEEMIQEFLEDHPEGDPLVDVYGEHNLQMVLRRLFRGDGVGDFGIQRNPERFITRANQVLVVFHHAARASAGELNLATETLHQTMPLGFELPDRMVGAIINYYEHLAAGNR